MKTEITRNNGRTYSIKDNKHRFLFPKEYKKLEDALLKKQKHSVKCQVNTGARINELRHVKVEDCFIEQKRIVLKVTKCKARKGEKKGRQRIIPISTQFAKYLNKYIKDNNLQKEDTLKILSTPALCIALKKTCKKIGIEDYYNISTHTFRKTLECWLMALGVDTLPLVAHIGHDVKTAAQSYVSPDIFSWEEKQEMREIIGDLYRR